MRPRLVGTPLVVLLVGLGLAASAALLLDYAAPAPLFCAEGGGCDALRQTALAHPLGLPLPLLGVGAFLLLGLLAVMRGPRVRQVNAVVTGVGGVVGALLLVMQVLLGHFCPYCTAVDVASVVLAWLAVDRVRAGWDPPTGFLASTAMSFGLAASLAGPFAWAAHEAGKIPAVIERELAASPPGEATVVDFVDFECPFCRQMQAKLAPALAARSGKVRLVRKMVPLTRIHPHALAAAQAACCADALGKGDAMADALFAAEVESLTPEGCEHIAVSLGLPVDPYRACLASPETQARLERERHEWEQAAARDRALPLMWVGTRKLVGTQEDATLSQALDEAIARAGS